MRLLRRFFQRQKVVSSLIGGLGNQMFQYAAGRALSSRLNFDLVLDTSPLDGEWDHTPRSFGLNSFNINAEIDTLNITRLNEIPLFEEQKYTNDWPRDIKEDIRISGYWQSEKFFSSIRPKILREFTLSSSPNDYVTHISKCITASQCSVSLHIRRGDYVSNPITAKFHGICPISYYKAGIEHISQTLGPHDLYVFTDDPEWVKKESTLPQHMTLIDCEKSSAAQDIWLMSLCHHHIIANSSFSWWGAWLGDEKGITIAPKNWFLDPAAPQSHIVPSRWLRL